MKLERFKTITLILLILLSMALAVMIWFRMDLI